MFHDFPMFSHDFPWNAEHIYTNLCLGALSFSLFASRETFLLARSTIRRAVCTSFYVRWIANNNSHQRIQQTWGVHSFNKHEKFTVAKLGAEKPTFMVCHGVSMSWFLRTNRQQKLANPQGTQVVHLPMRHDLLGMKLCSQIPNPQGLRTWLPWLMIQVVDRNKGPIRAFSGNNGPLGSSLSVPSEAICPEKILQLGQASLSGVFCWECLSIHVVL